MPIDNNRVEQQIRSFAVERNNRLFHHQVHRPQASARIYSIIATARANQIEPLHYLRFALHCMERFHEVDMPKDDLLPFSGIRDHADTSDIPWGLE